MRYALRCVFRSLALVLCALLAQARQFAIPGAGHPRTCRSSHAIPAPALRRADAPVPPAPDTS
jgi:hypothetical protein